MRRFLILATLLLLFSESFADSLTTKKVYLFPIREAIMPSTIKLTDKCLHDAQARGSDIIVIDVNTYGGLVDAADSVRTRLLNSPIPIYIFINNQAASAGALISIAGDSIYMREGASIGAATVVDQGGAAMPDKYQSFMRSMMRSTAEAHGKRASIDAHGDTIMKWVRDPKIAEAMVDPTTVIEGLIDSTKVLTFTTQEAIRWGYCEGSASSVDELLTQAGVTDYEIYEYRPTAVDRLLGFLTNPAFQGIVIMLIIGGIYFELQSPGIGFPLAVAIVAALLYFAPLYVEGLVANWELLLFIAGIILVILEIFVIPGFGVLGIMGIIAIVLGLAFAMVDSTLLKYIPTGELPASFIIQPIFIVIISVTIAIVASIILGRKFLAGSSPLRKKIVLSTSMPAQEGYISHDNRSQLVGKQAITTTALRPAGKVAIEDKTYEAAGENGLFIERAVKVTVIHEEGGVLYCRTIE